jgi:hypothetical protein
MLPVAAQPIKSTNGPTNRTIESNIDLFMGYPFLYVRPETFHISCQCLHRLSLFDLKSFIEKFLQFVVFFATFSIQK